jgi:hypothetical protein
MEFNVRIDFFRDLEDGPKGLRRVRCATASGRCATASGRCATASGRWCCPEWASMSTDSARPACGMDLRDIPARPTVASPPSSMAPRAGLQSRPDPGNGAAADRNRGRAGAVARRWAARRRAPSARLRSEELEAAILQRQHPQPGVPRSATDVVPAGSGGQSAWPVC